MKKYVLKKYPNRFWGVADLECYENGLLVNTITIKRYYKVENDWFYEFEEIVRQPELF